MNFDRQIRAHRARLKLTQVELARKLGVDSTTVSAWEAGENEPHRLAKREVMRIIQRLKTPVEEPVK